MNDQQFYTRDQLDEAERDLAFSHRIRMERESYHNMRVTGILICIIIGLIYCLAHRYHLG